MRSTNVWAKHLALDASQTLSEIITTVPFDSSDLDSEKCPSKTRPQSFMDAF